MHVSGSATIMYSLSMNLPFGRSFFTRSGLKARMREVSMSPPCPSGHSLSWGMGNFRRCHGGQDHELHI
jgi:hypothetical protein